MRLRLKHLICTGNRNKSKTVFGGLELVWDVDMRNGSIFFSHKLNYATSSFPIKSLISFNFLHIFKINRKTAGRRLMLFQENSTWNTENNRIISKKAYVRIYFNFMVLINVDCKYCSCCYDDSNCYCCS